MLAAELFEEAVNSCCDLSMSAITTLTMMKYLILSMENHCIYTMTQSSLIANALVAGDGDTTLRGINAATSRDYAKVTGRDWFLDTVYHMTTNNDFMPIARDLVTDAWRAQQTRIRLRQDLFVAWHSHVELSLARLNRHPWPAFESAALAALADCRPEEQVWSPLVEEYARITARPVDQVYRDLEMQLASDRSHRFRVSAMAVRWRDRINQVQDRSEYAAVAQEMAREFWVNAAL